MKHCLLILLFLSAIGGCSAAAEDSGQRLTGKVVAIADGDTLTLLVDSTQTKVRLAEIDAPESRQPWGNRSKQALATKVFGKLVTVEVLEIDRYGRTVGRVWLKNRDINREMVREGHAWVYRRYLIDESLLDDENAAKAVSAGLWRLPDPVAPWEWRRGNRAAPSFTEAPGGCSIKGNINAKGDRLYHLPGQMHYDRTRIDPSQGERWFCSEEEARAAGWRASQR
jgi:endonuclease YncB( thermonuclease family)